MAPASTFRGLVEFCPTARLPRRIRHVLWDFDGTLSLLRQGWPEVMLPMFVEFVPPRAGESAAELRQLLHNDIMHLNGKQTIYQMIALADRIRERGGQPADPLWYKHEYLRRLDEKISGRITALETKQAQPGEFLVADARELLEKLRARGLPMTLASGTDEHLVRREAELLDIARFFEGRIYGARDDYKTFSKKMLIDRILREIPGEQLLAFGDGYVEIQNTREVGGVAVGVANDEAHNGSGRFDEWKRQRLLGVGADLIIPDYRDGDALLECILAP